MIYSEFVAKRAKPLPTLEERVNHARLGMIGELGELADAWKKSSIYGKELDIINIREELGDLRFYAQVYINEGFTTHQIRNWELSTEEGLFALAVAIGKLSGLLPYDRNKIEIEECLSDVLHVIGIIAEKVGSSEEDTIQENMEKLIKRFPEGTYSDVFAVARLDKVSPKPLHLESQSQPSDT